MITIKTMGGSHRFHFNTFQIKSLYDKSSVQNSYATRTTEVVLISGPGEQLFANSREARLDGIFQRGN